MTEYPPPPPGNYPPPPPPGSYPPPPGGGGFPPPPGAGAPDNNLVWAILATVFCCLPLGIVAIIKSTQVSGLWAQGQHAEAQRAADDAKKFAMWAAIAGVIFGVIWIFIQVVVGVSFMNAGS